MEPIPQTKFVFPAAAQLGCGRRLHRMRQVGVSINHPLAPMPTAHCQLSDYHTSTNSTQKKNPPFPPIHPTHYTTFNPTAFCHHHQQLQQKGWPILCRHVDVAVAASNSQMSYPIVPPPSSISLCHHLPTAFLFSEAHSSSWKWQTF